LGAKFTEGEMAVLKVIVDKHGRHGACTLTRDAIGDVSGTSRGTVKNAVRTAAAEGLIEVRPAGHYNIITVSATWEAWLDRYGDAPPDGPR
jgi:DNA-binding GntR family transcriptional regulator